MRRPRFSIRDELRTWPRGLPWWEWSGVRLRTWQYRGRVPPVHNDIDATNMFTPVYTHCWLKPNFTRYLFICSTSLIRSSLRETAHPIFWEKKRVWLLKCKLFVSIWIKQCDSRNNPKMYQLHRENRNSTI